MSVDPLGVPVTCPLASTMLCTARSPELSRLASVLAVAAFVAADLHLAVTLRLARELWLPFVAVVTLGVVVSGLLRRRGL